MSGPGSMETFASTLAGGSEDRAPDDAVPFADWDRYELVREVGRGGMGVVYEARDRRLGRTAALKFIRGADPRATMRLLQEARAQARIDHPHVCKIFEVGEVEGRAYIAMQLVDGCPLGEAAARASLHDKVALTRDVALALHEAHTLGVLHRDVKPANILVETDADGRLRPTIVDFGLARHESEEHGLTETGAVMGTPVYMAPEQARGDASAIDRRSDVYGLGATLYELLGGAPPFAPGPAVKVLLAVLHDEPLPLRARVPSVPEDLETIAAKCLAKEPGRRYDSARALADDLDRYIRGEPILGRKAGLAERLWRRARRNRALVATAALSVVALGIVGGVAVHGRLQARRQAAKLEERARRSDQLTRDVNEIEWLLRTARLAPVHDLTREREMVRKRMALVAARTGGDALASYALGRGHLALDEDDDARTHLDAALAAGLDTPELHYARGVVLGRLHERALAVARRSGQGRWLEQRTRELDAELLRPALASLEKARGALLESPRYLDALIAYDRKDFRAAIVLGRQARAETPWLYEGLKLEADAYLALGAAGMQRDQAGATHDLEAAARAYDEALTIARSDASLYLGRADVAVCRTLMAADRGLPLADPVERVEEWCRRAAVIAPQSAAPHNKLARVRMYMANYLLKRGENAYAVLGAGLEAARTAAGIDDTDVLAHLQWAYIQSGRAYNLIERALDAREAIDETLAQFERSLELDPHNLSAMAGLGTAYIRRGAALYDAGKDPVDAYREGAVKLAAAIRMDPEQVAPYRYQLELYHRWGGYLSDRGRSPEPLTPPVREAFAGCLRATRGAGHCYEEAAWFHQVRVIYRLDAGLDPTAELDELDGLVAADPSPRLYTRQIAVQAAYLHARAAVRDGRDDAPARASLARGLAACYELAPEDAYCSNLAADGALLLARSRADLLHARELAALALARNPSSPPTAELLARAELRLGRVDEGIAVCERALAGHPDLNFPELQGTCGALLVAQARARKSTTIARAAVAMLDRAFALSPIYAAHHQPVAAEAAALAAAQSSP